MIFRAQTDDFTKGVGLAGIAFRMEKEVTDETWSLTAKLGCIDLIRSGVTTSTVSGTAPTGSPARSTNRVARSDRLQGLRREARKPNVQDYTRYPKIGESHLQDSVAFAEKWHKAANGRVTAKSARTPPIPVRRLHKTARKKADRLRLGMHVHTAQAQRRWTT